MTTAAAASPPAADRPHGIDERYARLPIDQVAPSKTNPRTHFDPLYITELAASVADKGVVQPILVRQVDAGSHKPMRFEIIAGECRYRASKEAAQTHIPAVIRQYSDEQVLELQLIENIHRKDLTPLEQAVGYRRLITTNPDKHSAASIAQRIGMSEAWVWDRLKLNDMIPEAQQILEQERMTVGHAILIARLKPEDQHRAVACDGEISTRFNGEGLWRHDAGFTFDEEAKASPGSVYDGFKCCSVRELEAWIKNHVRFDVAHAAKAQPLVFQEVAAAVEAAAAQPGRGRKVISITHEYRVADDARDGDERTYGSQSWERADGEGKSKVCEYSVLGVVVAGRGQGDTLTVCVARDKCRVHFGKVIAAKEKAAKLREGGDTAKARKVEKKQEQDWEKRNRENSEKRERWKVLRPQAVAAIAAKIKPAKVTDRLLAEVIEDRLDGGGIDRKEFTELLGGKVTAKTFARAWALLAVLDADYDAERLTPVAKKYGVDLKKLAKDLTKAATVPAVKAS